MPDSRVAVVGTTTDYIDIINHRFPQRVLFLTDANERAGAREMPPGEDTEILCDLLRPDDVIRQVEKHLKKWSMQLSGVACFDCESMALAASLAKKFSLLYVSPEAVAVSRNKFLSKQAWQKAGLPCPETELIQHEEEAIAFLKRLGKPVVIKPLTGSGSELVFVCRDESSCKEAFKVIKSRLANHPNVRRYAAGKTGVRQSFAVEEFVEGDEYSCDFIVDGKNLRIIRIAKKVPMPDSPIGTIMGYVLPSELPSELAMPNFCDQLQQATQALGISKAIVMLDFIVRNNQAVMLEMTPRPGGDCLPFLIRRSCGFDIIGAALDFAEGRSINVPEPSRWQQLVGLRLFAGQAGAIKKIGTDRLCSDPRVLECYIKRFPGHRVILPPQDYDSRLLGHVIFVPSSLNDISRECLELAGYLKLEMET